MWQAHTPNVNKPQDRPRCRPISRAAVQFRRPAGAQCSDPYVVYCYSYAWAIVNYINYQYTPHDIFILRSDFLMTPEGSARDSRPATRSSTSATRTGLGTRSSCGPELRFEHAFNTDAYDNPTATPGGGKKNQVMLAARPDPAFLIRPGLRSGLRYCPMRGSVASAKALLFTGVPAAERERV